MMLAVMLTLLVGTVRADGSKLEGTWLNEVKVWLNPEPSKPCPPQPQNPVTVQSMTTYMRGGILIEGGSPPAGGPPFTAVSRSAGHGIWERRGHHTFRLFFRSHSFDNLGRLVRITEVESHPRLIQGDNPETDDVVEPYYLSGEGTNRVTNFDLVNGTVTVTHGCNEATSRPFFFEDLSED